MIKGEKFLTLAAPSGCPRNRWSAVAFHVMPGIELMCATSTTRSKSSSATPLGLQSESTLHFGGGSR